VEALARVHNPAGLDIGAQTPEEIAVSILAEVVQVRRKAAERSAGPQVDRPAGLPAVAVAEGRDPVCGMSVAVAGAKHTADALGRRWYFCCGGCRERFLASPERFAGGAQSGGAA